MNLKEAGYVWDKWREHSDREAKRGWQSLDHAGLSGGLLNLDFYLGGNGKAWKYFRQVNGWLRLCSIKSVLAPLHGVLEESG